MIPFAVSAFGLTARFIPGDVLPTRIAVFASRKPEESIYDVAAKQRAALRNREARTVSRMRGAWKVAYKGIAARLKDVTDLIEAATENGDPVSPAWLYQQERWTAFLAAIRETVDSYSQTGEAETVAGQSDAVDRAPKDAAAMVRASGVRAGFVMLPRAATETMVGFLADGSPLNALFGTLGPQGVAIARKVFTEGVAAGDHPTKIARAFRKEIQVPRDRAVLIARTETIRAYTVAQQRNYEANRDVVVASRVVSSRDSRTCFLCLARDGTIIEHGETLPRHPGCRCALAPVVKYLDVDRGTGEAWLRAQPIDVQIDKLGPTRWELWHTGKVSLADLVEVTESPKWGKGLRPLNLAEIAENLNAGKKAPPQKVKVEGMGLASAEAKKESVAPQTWAGGVQAKIAALKADGPLNDHALIAVGGMVAAEIDARLSTKGADPSAPERIDARLGEIAREWGPAISRRFQLDRELAREEDPEKRRQYEAAQAQIEALRKERETLRAERTTVFATIREAYTDTMSEIRPMGGVAPLWAKGMRHNPQTRELVNAASALYPSDWMTLSNAMPTPLVARTAARGYYRDYDASIAAGTASTALHEIMHRMERAIPGLVDAERQYYDRRTAGDPKTYLKKLLPDHGYRGDEWVRLDQWVNPYQGKDYGGRAYEVLTMTVQELQDTGFNGVMTKDRETWHFLLGALASL